MGSNCTRDRDFHHIGETNNGKVDPQTSKKAKLSDFIVPSAPTLKLMSAPQSSNSDRRRSPRIAPVVGRQLAIRQCASAVPVQRAVRPSTPSASTMPSDSSCASLSNRPVEDAFPSLTSGSIGPLTTLPKHQAAGERNAPKLMLRRAPTTHPL